jgi:hypothetical protein
MKAPLTPQDAMLHGARSFPQSTAAEGGQVMAGGGGAAAPFLVWPVSCREFYRAICVAMIPALAWGTVIFGVRVFTMLLTSVAATTFTHALIKRFSRVTPQRAGWARGRLLIYGHSLVGVLVLVGLAHPTWPVWMLTVMALALPPILALLGGPGREPVHVAVVLVMALQFWFLPALARWHIYAGAPDAVLAHDRLFMGDIRDQRPQAGQRGNNSGGLISWPASRDLGGNDAVHMEMPSNTAAKTLNDISRTMEAAGHDLVESGNIAPASERDIRGITDRALALRLPEMDLLLLGVMPGRVGTVSLIAVVMAGLYLSYRYILRPRSVVTFVLAFLVTSALVAIWPSAVIATGLNGMWQVIKVPPGDVAFPGEIATLINYLVLSSDAGFAAVFILALPGTEPLTTRGRRIFLVMAGVAAAALHRMAPGLPAATLTLCVLMPFARLFDRLFATRSWLNAR